MKAKILWLTLVVGMMIGVTASAQDFGTIEQTRSRKLGRGVSNVLFSWLEIPKSMVDVDETHGGIAAWTWGVFRGVYRTGVRAKSGVVEIRYFWQPTPPEVLPEFPLMPDSQYTNVEWEVQEVPPPEQDKLDLLTRRILGFDNGEEAVEAEDTGAAAAEQSQAAGKDSGAPVAQ